MVYSYSQDKSEFMSFVNSILSPDTGPSDLRRLDRDKLVTAGLSLEKVAKAKAEMSVDIYKRTTTPVQMADPPS
jgi:hypothetical protein